MVDLNSSWHQASDKLDSISKECSFKTTLRETKNLGRSQSLNTNQQLVSAKEKATENTNLNGKNSNGDMEMDFIPNECEDLQGQKKSSLRSWERILRNSNNQASIDDSPNLPCLAKRTSSDYSSLDSHVHKKQILSTDSLSIPDSIAGGTPSASPPP